MISEILEIAGVGENQMQDLQIVGFKPRHTQKCGKKIHHEIASHWQQTNNGYEMTMRPNILFDNDTTNCDLFEKDGGHSVLVNADETHLDLLRKIIANPEKAVELVEAHSALAEENKAQQSFFIR